MMTASIDTDRQAIEALLTRYIAAISQANSQLMQPLFHTESAMFHLVDGNVSSIPIKGLFNAVDTLFTPSPEATSTIAYIDIAGEAAVARLDLDGITGNKFTNFFSFLKQDDQWQIATKTLHTYTNA